MSLSETTTVPEAHSIPTSDSLPKLAEHVDMVIERPSETGDTDHSGEVKFDIPNKESTCDNGEPSSCCESGVISDPGGEPIDDDKRNVSKHATTRDEDDVQSSGTGVHPGITGERVERLKAIVKQYQDVLYRHKDVSQFMSGDVLKVAEKCWQQIHNRIGAAVENKHDKIFDEFQAFKKLSDLDSLNRQHDSSQPAWRPSGIPNEDHLTMSSVEAKHTLVPQYEQQYEEAKQETQELQVLLSSKQKQLSALRERMRHKMNSLGENSDNIIISNSSS